MPYLSTGLARCSVDPGINRGARKLTRTPRVIKNKKKRYDKVEINTPSKKLGGQVSIRLFMVLSLSWCS